MRDDPVRLILKILTLGQHQNNFWIIQFCCLFLVLSIEIYITLPGIYLIINNINLITFMEYFTPYCFLQTGCATTVIYGGFLSKGEKIVSVLYTISKSLETQNPKFEMDILKKARKYNISSIFILILSVWTHLLCVPSLIDDDFETFIFYSAKRFFGDGPNCFFIGLTFLILLTAGSIVVVPMLFVFYFTFHIQFQLMWLLEYVERNLHKKLNIYSKNPKEQELVHQHLINVVKYRLCFKAAFNTIKIFQSIGIILMTSTGGIAGAMCIYNMKNNTPQSKSLKIYLVMVLLIYNVVMIGLCGQAISDESMKLRDVLYESPWYYWNTKNRKILLLIITNISDPWEISFYNLIPINHQLLTMGSKFAYSLAAVLSKIK